MRVFPSPKTLADLLNNNGSDDDDDSSSRMPLPLQLSPEAQGLLSLMGKPVQRALSTELTELSLLQSRPMILASPVIFVVP